jgi:hypothetical protein
VADAEDLPHGRDRTYRSVGRAPHAQVDEPKLLPAPQEDSGLRRTFLRPRNSGEPRRLANLPAPQEDSAEGGKGLRFFGRPEVRPRTDGLVSLPGYTCAAPPTPPAKSAGQGRIRGRIHPNTRRLWRLLAYESDSTAMELANGPNDRRRVDAETQRRRNAEVARMRGPACRI